MGHEQNLAKTFDSYLVAATVLPAKPPALENTAPVLSQYYGLVNLSLLGGAVIHRT